MKKQVAKILGNMAFEIKQCDCKDPALGLLIKQATQEICQLSQEKWIRWLEEHGMEAVEYWIEVNGVLGAYVFVPKREWQTLKEGGKQ